MIGAQSGEIVRTNQCRGCRRPIVETKASGWSHQELPEYRGRPTNCLGPEPLNDEDYRTLPLF